MSDTRVASAPPPPKAVAQAPAPDASKIMTLFVAIVATLYFGKEVLVPVTLALLLAFLLAPLVALLQRLHLGKVPSVLLGVILALGVVISIGGVIGEQIADLSTDIPKYIGTVENKVSTVRQYTVGRVVELADRIGVHHAAVAADTAVGAPARGPAAPPIASQAPAATPAASSAVPLVGSASW